MKRYNPHHVGRGLGSGDDPEIYLDKIPNVTPLRAAGLKQLIGKKICGLVWDSDISINYGPLNGSLKGEKLGVVAFRVIEVKKALNFSSSPCRCSRSRFSLRVRNSEAVTNQACSRVPPVPIDSSKPFDITP